MNLKCEKCGEPLSPYGYYDDSQVQEMWNC